jgi:hypothetical protein
MGCQSKLLRYVLIVRQFNRDEGVGWPIWTWARLQTTNGRSEAYAYFLTCMSQTNLMELRMQRSTRTSLAISRKHIRTAILQWPNLAALKALTPYLQCLAGIPLNPEVQP